jgi:hypothetical protein
VSVEAFVAAQTDSQREVSAPEKAKLIQGCTYQGHDASASGAIAGRVVFPRKASGTETAHICLRATTRFDHKRVDHRGAHVASSARAKL